MTRTRTPQAGNARLPQETAPEDIAPMAQDGRLERLLREQEPTGKPKPVPAPAPPRRAPFGYD